MNGKKTILAVDDSTVNLLMLSATLGGEYSVITVQDGAEAVALSERNIPDLILLDVMLPGKDGFDICGELKKNPLTKDIPVIFITAKNDSDSIVKGLSTGACDYVCKPFSSGELLNRVRIQLAVSERNRAMEKKIVQEEKRVRELEEKLDFLQLVKDNMQVSEIVCDSSGRIVSASKSSRSVFSFEGSTLEGLCFWEIVEREEDKTLLKSFFSELFEVGHGVLRYVLPAGLYGGRFVLESSGRIICGRNKERFAVISTEDITDSVSMQADVRKNLEFQKRLRLVSQKVGSLHGLTASCVFLTDSLMELTEASEIILLLGRKDSQTQFFYHNSGLKTCKIGKLPPSENDYTGFAEVLKKNSGSVICNIQSPYIPETLSSRNRRYVLYPLIIGKMLAGVFYLGKNSSGGITQENVYAVATVANLVRNCITQKMYEKRIVSQEKIISNFFKYSANGIITVSGDMRLLRYNRRFLELFDIEENSDLTGRPLETVLGGGVFKEITRLVGKVGKPPLFETATVTGLREDGTKMYIEATASKISTPNGMICSLVFTDVTGLKNIDSAVMTATTLAEEKERTRLAQELHDGLGAQLSSINIYINLILSGGISTSEIFSTLKLTKDILVEAIAGVKAIADNLHPVILGRFGLVATVNNIIEGLENSHLIKFGFTHSKYVPLEDKNLELSVYRIINELINNTMKHSHAKNTAISLSNEDGKLVLEYADDGRGFCAGVAGYSKDTKSGRGLQNIAARVKASDGKFSFKTAPGKGFKVFIEIPVPEQLKTE